MTRAKICMCLIFALLLSGCTNPFARSREIEALLVVQTMGIDSENGSVRLSLAAAADGAGSGPRRLTAEGGSVSGAMERIYDSAYEQELFCHHVSTVLIGETAADEGIDNILGYICRSSILRIDAPVFIVRGGSAEELILHAGDDSRGISEILQNVREKLDRRGGGVFTGAEIMRGTLRNGSCLVCTLVIGEAAESAGAQTEQAQDSESGAEDDSENAQTDTAEESGEAAESASQERPAAAQSSENMGEGTLTAVSTGYAVIRDGKLCKYIDGENAAAAAMLLNRGGIYDVELTAPQGGTAVLEVSGVRTEYAPRWESDGGLSRMDIRVTAQYSVLETRGASALESAEYVDRLTAALETELLTRIGNVLRTEAELKADFLALAEKAERSDPKAFRTMHRSFAELLPGLEMQVTVSCRLRHTNDMKDM